MKVLATTSQSVLLVDCFTGEARVLHRGAGLYYGIARVGASHAVAARRRLVSSPVPREDERGCILVFDEALRQRDVLEAPFALRDMHQIAWFDDRLWVTCSFDDMIVIHDGGAWRQWSPAIPVAPAGTRPVRDVENDRYHYNSFLFTGDEIALLAHNHGPSDVHFFDRRSLAFRRTVALGSQAHDLWLDGATLHTCSSIEGRLVGTNGWTFATGGFPRGVCLGDAYRAIGISALSERGQRDFASAAIALYDASWQIVHYVHLVHEGMVLDLAPAPVSERGISALPALETCRFPLLDRLSDSDLLDAQGSAGSGSR